MSFFADQLGDEPVSADDIERRAESNGLLPEGKYKAILNGAKQVESKQKGTPGYELTFRVTDGPFEGKDITDTLWTTDGNRDRVNLFAYRLGGLVKNADGKLVPVEGKEDFLDLLDTPCVIDVKHEKYKREKDGQEGVAARLTYSGIWNIDDPRPWEKKEEKKDDAKKDAAAKSGAAGKPTTPREKVPAKAGAAAGGKKAIDTSNL